MAEIYSLLLFFPISAQLCLSMTLEAIQNNHAFCKNQLTQVFNQIVIVIKYLYSTTQKTEVLPTWASVFTGKERGFQALAELVKRNREKVSPEVTGSSYWDQQ